ncbi:MAG: efflux RND transporter permease subunit [Terriglobales bacterium]
MSKFFIRRPIVAMVIAIVTVLIGAITILRLPISQFPNIVPPETKITATFPGADAKTLAQSVATPIEEQMSGVDNMNYMYSLNATANSQTTMIVDFAVGTNPNTDLILTQMRETQASSKLPSPVNDFGVTVQKSTHAPLMLIALYSPNGSRSAQFLANFAYINLVDPISRLPGVADVLVFGAGPYAMRIWLDPNKLARLGITTEDVIQAVQQQNTVNPAGQLGAQPAPPGQEFTYAVRAQGRLVTPRQFGNIIVREEPDGSVVRVKDLGRVELGTQNYSTLAELNGKPSAIVAVYRMPGSNAVDTARGVRQLIHRMRGTFPPGIASAISIDQTLAVTAGIKEILFTLGLALVLVIFVVFIFLQGWRATLIPLLAVPVSLIGTFILFPLFGFNINTLTMFGMVLAIGLVVDDAIVVVEVVERHIEDGLAPRAAAEKAMAEIGGPVVGIALVLSAVFIPTAFIPGITGRLYQQFAMVIAVSVILSAFNALSLSPALAALLLRPHGGRRQGLLGGFFNWFNGVFGRATSGYVRACRGLLRKAVVAMLLLAIFAGLAVWFGNKLPAGFLPDEDQGYFMVNLQLPDSASLQRTAAAAAQIERMVQKMPGVRYTTSVVGFSLLSYVETSYNAFFFITLNPWDTRTARDQQFEAIKYRLNQELRQLPQGSAFSFSPPAIPGVGTAGGFTLALEDRSGQSSEWLAANVQLFMAAARKRPEIAGLNTSFLPSVPQRFLQVDRAKAMKLGVPIPDIYQTAQAFLGGTFVNYFNRFGRQWQVYVEGEGAFRNHVQDLSQYYVRNNQGQMIPMSVLAKFVPRQGPEFIMHFDEYPAAQINGSAAPGYSSAQAMTALQQVFKKTMPAGMGYDYMAMSFQEQKAAEGVSPGAIFGLSLLFVFLILAALYESWSLPFSVLLSVPIAVFGAFGVLLLRRAVDLAYLPPYLVQLQNDVYAQIGLVMLIGLAAKNAILIVAFAKDEHEKGRPLAEAALDGARLRLRPILMTSFAFIFGVAPLWIATGAGSVSRRIMGTTVIGGMIGLSLIAIFFIPAIFYVVERMAGKPEVLEMSPEAAPEVAAGGKA